MPTKSKKVISEDFFQKEGARGGKKTLAKFGKDHFKKIVNKRWKKVRSEKKASK